jgi:hypothetical protein
VTQPYQPLSPKRDRRERARSSGLRRALLVVATLVAFALGTGLGLALDHGSGAKGTQTCERTVRLVTVTVSKP